MKNNWDWGTEQELKEESKGTVIIQGVIVGLVAVGLMIGGIFLCCFGADSAVTWGIIMIILAVILYAVAIGLFRRSRFLEEDEDETKKTLTKTIVIILCVAIAVAAPLLIISSININKAKDLLVGNVIWGSDTGKSQQFYYIYFKDEYTCHIYSEYTWEWDGKSNKRENIYKDVPYKLTGLFEVAIEWDTDIDLGDPNEPFLVDIESDYIHVTSSNLRGLGYSFFESSSSWESIESRYGKS